MESMRVSESLRRGDICTVTQKHLLEQPNLYKDLLKTLFEIILFEDCSNQWSLSRPMLSLVLLIEASFNDLQVRRACRMRPHSASTECGILPSLSLLP